MNKKFKPLPREEAEKEILRLYRKFFENWKINKEKQNG